MEAFFIRETNLGPLGRARPILLGIRDGLVKNAQRQRAFLGGEVLTTRHRPYVPWIAFAGTVAAIRVGALWILVSAVRGHRETLGLFPFVFFLYPEAWLLPKEFSWTMWYAIGFTLALILGTSLFVFVVYVIDRVLSRLVS